MSERESIRRQTTAREEQEQVDLSVPAAQTFDVSDLLDEIDSVLEENAEEFVKSFVQKGGQ
jgi:ubiquitin-like protein Pup